jgi:hypothetical protein
MVLAFILIAIMVLATTWLAVAVHKAGKEVEVKMAAQAKKLAESNKPVDYLKSSNPEDYGFASYARSSNYPKPAPRKKVTESTYVSPEIVDSTDDFWGYNETPVAQNIDWPSDSGSSYSLEPSTSCDSGSSSFSDYGSSSSDSGSSSSSDSGYSSSSCD